MIRANSKIHHGYYLAFAAVVLALFSVVEVTTEVKSAKKTHGLNSETIKGVAAQQSATMKTAHEQRVRFAANHGVADPVSLVAAVGHSPMANLLISVAIEESRGNPVAVGSSGEQGAWQVKASDWGFVPEDIYGQAVQAERIICGLMIHTKGNRKKALALYNGGTAPPGKSYRYAERVLRRTRHLQVAVKHLPNDYNMLRQALLKLPGNTRMLKLTYQSLEKRNA